MVAVELVTRDLVASTSPRPRVMVDADVTEGVVVTVAESWSSPAITTIAEPDGIVEIADYLQEFIMEDLAVVWPVRPALEEVTPAVGHRGAG